MTGRPSPVGSGSGSFTVASHILHSRGASLVSEPLEHYALPSDSFKNCKVTNCGMRVLMLSA